MDSRQPQPQPQSRQYLKPPSAHQPSQQAHQQRASTSSAPSTPRAPVTAHPTATIADTAAFQGTFPIAIGAGTIFHPRARVYSFEGPVVIGEGCVICEKGVIGSPPTPPTPTPTPTSTSTSTVTSAATSPTTPSSPTERPKEGVQTRIAHGVIISPLAMVYSGASISSAATIDSLATVHSHANIGAHAKVCASCVVPARSVVKEWVVVWGAGGGLGQRRRKRAVKGVVYGDGDGSGPGLEGKVIEDARLAVLNKERETLVKLIGAGAGGGARRR